MNVQPKTTKHLNMTAKGPLGLFKNKRMDQLEHYIFLYLHLTPPTLSTQIYCDRTTTANEI